ncbi:MAG: hypothetical protein ACM3UU_05395 [Ignavibacteriales bacterium]
MSRKRNMAEPKVFMELILDNNQIISYLNRKYLIKAKASIGEKNFVVVDPVDISSESDKPIILFVSYENGDEKYIELFATLKNKELLLVEDAWNEHLNPSEGAYSRLFLQWSHQFYELALGFEAYKESEKVELINKDGNPEFFIGMKDFQVDDLICCIMHPTDRNEYKKDANLCCIITIDGAGKRQYEVVRDEALISRILKVEKKLLNEG